MDVITQGALGAAFSQAVLGNRNKHIPWLVGALAGMAADLDVLLGLNHEPMSTMLWHRQFTHSLIFIPVGAFIVFLCLMIFSYFRQHWRLVAVASLLGYATHAILDAFTSYGTVLFWPWIYTRISWDIVSIIDPVFTVPLIIGTIWSVRRQNRLAAGLGLLFAILFLGFNTFQHHRAMRAVEDFSAQQNMHLTTIRTMPTWASSTQWRAIAKQGSCFFIANVITPIGGGSSVQPVAKIPAFSRDRVPFPLSEGQQRDLNIFSWFTSGYLLVAKQQPLTVVDGRYTSGDRPIIAFWGIQFEPENTHIIKLRQVPINESCQ